MCSPTGVIHSTYDNKFRHKHQLYLSILKQFGFGQRIMETRINSEVIELIKQARITGGKPFDPNDMLHMCVVNVITSIFLGRRFHFDDPLLKELVDAIHEVFMRFVKEVTLFPFLRFIPPFRERFKLSLDAANKLPQYIDRQVSLTNYR